MAAEETRGKGCEGAAWGTLRTEGSHRKLDGVWVRGGRLREPSEEFGPDTRRIQAPRASQGWSSLSGDLKECVGRLV